MATCSCEYHCKTQEEMRSRHGEPATYADAVWNASDCLMVTPDEARAAVAKYRREWDAVAKK